MTVSHRPSLPDFGRPPVVEVTLSVQYERLKNIRTPHLGLFWAAVRSQFPHLEEYPPIPPVIEALGPTPELESGMRVEFLKVPPVPRCLFINADGSELIQVQKDRFIANWRQTRQSAEYPRYEHVREMFVANLGVYTEFLESERLGSIAPNQCEVTYVNHIRADEIWNHAGQLDRILTVWNSRYSDEFLGTPEDVRCAIRYAITDGNDALGRLHVSIEPKYAPDRAPMLVMSLTARGRPKTQDLSGVLGFFDLGREWIVRGFTSITSTEMHHAWRRHDKR
jgi:uncharacterized protein (TIGR04255 family)